MAYPGACLLAVGTEDQQGVSRLHQVGETQTAACPLEGHRPCVGREAACWEADRQGLGACCGGHLAGKVYWAACLGLWWLAGS